jgi:hypothetical protein
VEVAQPLQLGGEPAAAVDRAGRRRGQQHPGLAELEGQDLLGVGGTRAGSGPAAAGTVEQVGEGRLRVGRGAVMAPVAAARVEAVVAEQPVAVAGQQVDRLDQVVADGVVMK